MLSSSTKVITTIYFSQKKFIHKVPSFMWEIIKVLSFEGYHNGRSCMISSLSSNKISFMTTKTAEFEALNFWKDKKDHQKHFI